VLRAGTARAGGAAIAIAVALSACAAPASNTSTVSSSSLTVYASAPPAASADARARDVLAAEQLAYQRSGGRAGKYRVRLVVVRDPKISDAARTAIQDTDAIAYVGEIVPGTSADSLGIVGDQQILQVSPTDNAVELTQASPAVSGSPSNWYENLKSTGRTFARVVPTSALEARVLVAEVVRENVTKLFVAEEGGHYGAALAAAVQQAARGGSTLSVTVGPPSAAAKAGADAVLYAGADPSAAKSLFDSLAAAKPSTKLLVASALADDTFAGSLSAGAQTALVASSPGFMPSSLPASAQTFVQAFRTAYGRAPATEAVFGYEAMDVVLSVLQQAGTGATSRTTVIKDFFALRNHSSVLGSYSINANGDTSLDRFVISRVRGGRLTPVRQGQLSG
jgi:branched-chain amino acid transport system substrate-binding protein